MNIEAKKDAIKYDEVIAGYGSEVLSETDVILSDTAPDILRILKVDAIARIKEKDVTSDKVILRGEVDIAVLYVPDPQMSDAPVKAVNATCNFTDVCQAEGVGGDMKVQCFVDVAEPDYTVINSRKINVKVVVKTQFKASRICESTFVSDLEGDMNVEIKKDEISVFRQENTDNYEIVVSDKIEFSQNEPAALEILKISADVSGNDAKLLSEKCVIKGICKVNTLYLSAMGGEVEFMEYEIPFTEVLDIPDINEEMDVDIDYTVSDIYYETDDTGDGISSIGVEVKITASVNVSGEEKARVLSDCYSSECEIALTRKECCVDRIFSVSRPQILIKGDVYAEESKPAIARVCNVVAKPIVDAVMRDDASINLEGHLTVCVLYITNDENIPICTLEDIIPFNYSINAECEKDFAADCSIHLESLSYTLANERTVCIRANADACIKIICKEKINVIEEINVSECKDEKQSSIIIYFVQQGDSLWDVAKKYKTNMEKILELNNISENSQLTSGMKLLIPTS